MPELEGGGAFDHLDTELADIADGNADGGEDTGKLGDVEGGSDGLHSLLGIAIRLDGRSLVGSVRETGHGFLVLFGRCLVDLVGDHAGHLLIRSPEGLADGNGVIHNGHHLGGVVVSVAVVEDGVLAFPQTVHVTVGEDGCDVEALAQFLAVAGAVQDVHAAEGGDFRRRAGDLDAELGATLVDVQLTGLEHGDAVGVVEIGQDHVVVQEAVEVFIQAQHLVHFFDGEGVGFLGLVLFHEGEEFGLLVFLEDGLDGVEAQGFHFPTLLGLEVGAVGGELGQQGGPIGLGDGLFADAGEGGHGVHGCLPGGVHSLEVQHALGHGFGQGLEGDLVGRGGEVAFDGGNLLHTHVHGAGEGGFEADELAAHEVIGHFIFYGIDGGEGFGGLVPEGEDFLGGGLLPFGVVCAGGVEGFDLVGGDAGDAATVHGAGDAGDGLDELGGVFVSGAGGGDDAVSVEAGAGEDLHVVGGILQGNLVLLEAEVLEDLAGRCLQAGAVGVIGIEVLQLEAVGLFEQEIGVPHYAGEPLGGADDLVHADAAVAVQIDHLEGLFVELKAFGGAAQHGPHLAVQLIQVANVFSAENLHADSTTYGSVLPGVNIGFLFHIRRVKVSANIYVRAN